MTPSATVTPALIDAMRRINPLLQSGDFATARARLREIVAEHPAFVEALRLLAGTEQALGDPLAAETLLRRAVELDPNWTPSLAALGELLLTSDRVDEAEPLLLRASRRLSRAALVLARHYNDTQRFADAASVAALLCASPDAEAELVAQHVTALAALDRIDEAVTSYRRAANASPGNPRAAHALAIALDAAARHVESEQVSADVIARGNAAWAVHQTHARSLIALGEFDRAELALRETVRLQPRSAEAQSSLARLVWMRSGDTAQTTAGFDDALLRFPNDPALLAAKAAVLHGAGDARGGFACLSALASHPQAASALLVRAGLSALEFDPSAALELADRALRAAPASIPARSLRVAALLGVGDATAALPDCEALRIASPDDQYLIALQTTAWRLLDDERYQQLCDYGRLVAPFELSPPAGWSDLGTFLTDVRRSLDRLHDPSGHPLLFQSLRNGTETTDDLARANDPVIQALFRAFDEPIRTYLASVGHGSDPLGQRNEGGYRFNGSWSVKLRSAGYHNNHVHPRGWVSSACYIDLPDCMHAPHGEAGALTFGEPGLLTNPALRSEHFVRPATGMLVLFPSYFWHGTVPFASAQTRLTVAFDVVPAST